MRQCICMHPSFRALALCLSNQRCVALCYTLTESICISISCWLHHLTAPRTRCTCIAIIKSTQQLGFWLSKLCNYRNASPVLHAAVGADGRERRNYLLLLRILESPHVNLCSDASLSLARAVTKAGRRARLP